MLRGLTLNLAKVVSLRESGFCSPETGWTFHIPEALFAQFKSPAKPKSRDPARSVMRNRGGYRPAAWTDIATESDDKQSPGPAVAGCRPRPHLARRNRAIIRVRENSPAIHWSCLGKTDRCQQGIPVKPPALPRAVDSASGTHSNTAGRAGQGCARRPCPPRPRRFSDGCKMKARRGCGLGMFRQGLELFATHLYDLPLDLHERNATPHPATIKRLEARHCFAAASAGLGSVLPAA